MSEWINYNGTYNLWNFPEYESDTWKRLYLDLQNHSLNFPENFSKLYMRTYMERGVLTYIINPTDDFEWTVDLI